MNFNVKFVFFFRFSSSLILLTFLGGIIGFSSSEGTVQRWVLTSHIVATLRMNMVSVLHMTRRPSRPKEMQKSRINFDEEAVRKCCDLLKQWPPMFNSSTSIVSLSSGMNASTEVRKCMIIEVYPLRN